MKYLAKILKTTGVVFGVLLLVYLLLPFIGSIFIKCPRAIYGEENATGARIYLNGDLAGVMEKSKCKLNVIEYDCVRLCTRIKKGDHLRAEKDGYETYTSTLDPSINVSASTSAWVWIELTPLANKEKTKAQ